MGGKPRKPAGRSTRAELRLIGSQLVRTGNRILALSESLAGRPPVEVSPTLVRALGLKPTAKRASVAAAFRKLMSEEQGNVSAVARRLNRAAVQVRRWSTLLDTDPDSFRR